MIYFRFYTLHDMVKYKVQEAEIQGTKNTMHGKDFNTQRGIEKERLF